MNAGGEAVEHYTPGTPMRLAITFETDGASSLSLEAFLVDAVHQKQALASLHQFHGITLPDRAGRYRTVLELPGQWLASGTYRFDLATSIVNADWDHYVEDVIDFDVIGSNPGGESWDFKQSMGYGAFAMPCVRPPQFVAEPHDGSARR